MKATGVIAALAKAIEEHGNLDVIIEKDNRESVTYMNDVYGIRIENDLFVFDCLYRDPYDTEY